MDASNFAKTVIIISIATLAASVTGGCMLTRDSGRLAGPSLRSVDGLERVDIPLAGTLELRPHHQVGSYDKITVSKPTMSYLRDSHQLTPAARRVFLRLLRESMVSAIDAAGIPIEETPGACTMEIELAAIGTNIDYTGDSHAMATMTMVMQFRDSKSREPLLRYSTERLIESPEDIDERDERMKAGLSETVDSLNIAVALRDAGLGDDDIREGCQGTLARLGRAAQARSGNGG